MSPCQLEHWFSMVVTHTEILHKQWNVLHSDCCPSTCKKTMDPKIEIGRTRVFPSLWVKCTLILTLGYGLNEDANIVLNIVVYTSQATSCIGLLLTVSHLTERMDKWFSIHALSAMFDAPHSLLHACRKCCHKPLILMRMVTYWANASLCNILGSFYSFSQ